MIKYKIAGKPSLESRASAFDIFFQNAAGQNLAENYCVKTKRI